MALDPAAVRVQVSFAMREEKVGRNDPCPCGSGKKYKNCCLGAAVSPSLASLPVAPPSFDPTALMLTVTGECVQPARAYFDILDAAALDRALRALRCVDVDLTNRRRVWLWAHEARELTFKVPYERLSPQLHPIVIGSLLERGSTLVIEVRCWERLVAALKFFRACIPAAALRLRSVHLVNRLISGAEGVALPSVLDAHFQGPALSGPTFGGALEGELERLTHMAQRAPLKALWSFAAEVAAAARAPLPPLEELKCAWEKEDDLEVLSLNLGLRGLVAREHFHGNTDVTLYDMFLKVSAKL